MHSYFYPQKSHIETYWNSSSGKHSIFVRNKILVQLFSHHVQQLYIIHKLANFLGNVMYPDDYIGYMELIPTVIGVVVTHVYKLG